MELLFLSSLEGALDSISPDVLSALILATIIGSLLGLPFGIFARQNSINPRHLMNRKRARKVARELHRLPSSHKRLAYLRTINPFVFEELLLDAFERNGYRVKRSARYSGDGGIDGIVRKGGRTWLIQAKRYSGHIQSTHVQAFAKLAAKRRCSGFFCHTGRTGRQSHEHARQSRRITIISGDRLLALLLSQKGWSGAWEDL